MHTSSVDIDAEVEVEEHGHRPGRVPPPPAAAVPDRAVRVHWRSLAVVAVLTAGALAAGSLRFQPFGDELYFLAAGRRPSWGYADQPFLVPLLARVLDGLSGGSLLVVRSPAWLAAGATVVVTGALAAEFGAARRGQLLAAVTAAICPQFVGIGQQLATASLDPLLWSLALLALVRWTGRPADARRDRHLVVVGVAVAVALTVKMLVLGLLLGIAAGVLVSGPRALFRRPVLLACGGAVTAALVPFVGWQAGHGWPQLAMGEVTRSEAVLFGGPAEFLPTVLYLAGLLPGVFLLARGLWALLCERGFRAWRWAGIAAVVVGVLVVAGGGRPYYLASLFPLLFAAGAAALPATTGIPDPGWPARLRRAAVSKPVLAAGVAVTIVALLPVTTWTGEQRRTGDGAGWIELAEDLRARVGALPAADRDGLVIVTSYYWQAAALDRYGPERGLPAAYSGSRGFGYFGAPPEGARRILFVGDPGAVPGLCGTARPLPPHRDPHADPMVNGVLPLTVCSPAGPWPAVWPRIRTMLWPLAHPSPAVPK